MAAAIADLSGADDVVVVGGELIITEFNPIL